MGSETIVTFSSDGLRLNGVLQLPDAEPAAIVFGSHGLFSDVNSPKQCDMAGCCNAAGIAYFRFSHRGCGESEGTSTDAIGFWGRVRDLAAAVEAVLPRFDRPLPVGLFGSSMGGAVCLAVAATIHPAAVVTYAAPVRSIGAGKGPVLPEGIPEWILRHPDFGFDLREGVCGIPHVLVVHGEADPVVPVSHAREIFDRVAEPKRLILQPSGDHPMSDPMHQAAFRTEAMAWFRKWLLAADSDALATSR